MRTKGKKRGSACQKKGRSIDRAQTFKDLNKNKERSIPNLADEPQHPKHFTGNASRRKKEA